MSIAPINIAVTTGDPDGIGTEITAKALAKLKPVKGVLFYLWRSPTCSKKHLKLLDSQFKRIVVNSWPEALATKPSSYKELVDINSNLSPAQWVEISARASMFGHIQGIATSPLSKGAIQDAGYNVIGHTELLMKISNKKDLFMGFLGKEFNVLLATGHLAIQQISSSLDLERLKTAIQTAHNVKSLLPSKFNKKPLALLGLNPHAGEAGIIGSEEQSFYFKALAWAKENKIDIEGPLVPDTAFFPSNWNKYSFFISSYHDQGLIPFKMIHGQDSGVHITFGLPFVRTSVDHGTAKTLFGKNKANPNSMLEALNWAVKLAKIQQKDS